MKSKTSCFNTTILKKNLSHYWPVWILFLCYLMLVLPVNIWMSVTSKYYYENMTTLVWHQQIMGEVIRGAIIPAPVFLFAVAAALVVFSYLYTAKNANMIHALPVNRLELFVTNYVSGILFLLIPELIAFVTAVIVCLAHQITCIEYLFWWFLCTAGVSFFAYSLAVFVAMFTGLAFAVPLYFIIANYLYVGCLYLIHVVKKMLCYGLMENTWNPGESCILSPLYYLTNNLRARVIYDEDNLAAGIRIYGGKLVAIYAVAAIVFTAAAYYLYKRRQIENAGDFISIGIVRPIFRWGVAFCGGISLTVSVAGIIREARGTINIFPYMLAGMIIFCGICFWLAEMLLQKNFKVFRKKRLVEWAALSVVSLVVILLFKLDVFGIERRLPEVSEIETAFVYMDYPIQVSEEELTELIALHQKIISDKKEYQKNEHAKEGKYYYTTFRYYLKDGGMLERRYALPVTEEYLRDEETPSAKIIAWEKQKQRLKQQILGINYEHNEYYNGYIDLFSKEGESMTYYFEKEEISRMIEAVEKDVEEGNFDAYQILSEQQEKEVFANGLGLNYYNTDNTYSTWDYFYNYRYYADIQNQSSVKGYDMAVSDSCSYISFGTECVNTIQALEELGIVNDEWHLYTYQEQEKLKLEK